MPLPSKNREVHILRAEDRDCSHETKRHLLLGRNDMTTAYHGVKVHSHLDIKALLEESHCQGSTIPVSWNGVNNDSYHGRLLSGI